MHKAAKRATIYLKVANIEQMAGLRLTIDYNAPYGGWGLEEDTDIGVVSTAEFGLRREYADFIDYLDTIVLGLVLGQKVPREPKAGTQGSPRTCCGF